MPESKSSVKALQDQFIETLSTAQNVVLDSVNGVTKSLSSLDTNDLPKPEEIWNSSFDFLGRVIETQRNFGASLFEALTPAKAESSAS